MRAILAGMRQRDKTRRPATYDDLLKVPDLTLLWESK